jgi:hypothetical protein
MATIGLPKVFTQVAAAAVCCFQNAPRVGTEGGGAEHVGLGIPENTHSGPPYSKTPQTMLGNQPGRPLLQLSAHCVGFTSDSSATATGARDLVSHTNYITVSGACQERVSEIVGKLVEARPERKMVAFEILCPL